LLFLGRENDWLMQVLAAAGLAYFWERFAHRIELVEVEIGVIV
jgi:hypothetical protein